MARQFTRHEDGLNNIIYADYINELQEALEEDDIRIDGKADREHLHPIEDVQNLETRLSDIESNVEGKSDSGHKHSASDLSSGIIGINFLPVGTSEGTVAAGDHDHDEKYLQTDAIIHLNSHFLSRNNPHNVTKSQVGLGNVDNTSDVDKPISLAVQLALNAKSDSTHTHSAGDIDSGTLSASRVPNLDASKITSGTFSDARIPLLSASKIDSGVLHADRIPSLPATKINSGTFSESRIPSLSASKIGSGTISFQRLPTGTGSSQVAVGNHKHGPNLESTLLVWSHKTNNTNVSFRVAPGTTHNVIRTISTLNTNVARLNSAAVSADGFTWWFVWVQGVGIGWMASTYLTAI